jgi:peptide/nickel transport system substrate-binding protein
VVAGITLAPTTYNPYTIEGDSPSTYSIVDSVLPSVFLRTGAHRYLPNTDLLSAEPTMSHDSHGRQVVTYPLSAKANWSDGTSIGVADFSYLVSQAKKLKALFAVAGYDRVASVAKGSDDRHVVVTFSHPYTDWRELFNPLLPSHYLGSAGWDHGLDGKIPVSAGPFRLSSSSSATVVLARDTRYFGTKPRLDGIRFRVIPDSAAAIAAVNSGQLDVFAQDPQSMPMSTASNTKVVDGGYYAQLDFNAKQKALKNQKVRQAIALALDRGAIARAASTDPRRLNKVAGNRLFASGWHGGTNNGATLRHDPARAKQLLKAAGYGPGKRLSLRLATVDSNPQRVRAATVISTQLAAIGISVTVQKQPLNLFYTTTLGHHQFDLALYEWDYSAPATQAPLQFGCSGENNYARYCNTQLDKQLSKAAGTTDTDKSNALLNAVDRQLWTDMPTAPLYQTTALLAVSPTLHGVTYNATEFTAFWNTASWHKG